MAKPPLPLDSARLWSFSFVAAVVAVVVFSCAIILGNHMQKRHVQEYKDQVRSDLNTVKARLQGAVSSVVFLNQGLASIVAIRPDIARLELDRLTTELLNRSQLIRRVILLKQDGGIHVSPSTEMEPSLGNYLRFQDDAELTGQMIEKRKTLVLGPRQLVDGSHFIVCTPVFLNLEANEAGSGAYWGLVALVLDKNSLFWQAGLLDEKSSLNFALRGPDGSGSKGAVFFGQPEVFDAKSLLMDISLPYGYWKLAALPEAGWLNNRYYFYGAMGLGLIVSLMAGALTFILLDAHHTIRHLALHDTLTHLPNRILLADRAEQALAKARRYQQQLAVVHLDLDNFKPINDSMGHKAGDKVLMEIAKRMLACTRETDTVARIGGDEFILILTELEEDRYAEVVAEKIISEINRSIVVEHSSCQIGVSIGIAIFPQHGSDLESLSRSADAAMYRAKQRGKNQYALASSYPISQKSSSAQKLNKAYRISSKP